MLRKILAVDDSALIHQMYKLFLSRYKNCKLVSAMNGLEALDKLGQEEGIDLILLDINMPVMNGAELLRAIADDERWSRLTRVIISTDGSTARREEAAGLDVRCYLEKPFSPEVLRDVLNDVAEAV